MKPKLYTHKSSVIPAFCIMFIFDPPSLNRLNRE